MNTARGLIVIIEDHHEVYEPLAMMLRKEGYGVEWAKTGEDGLDMIRKRRPAAAILDLGLPGMSGQEVCQQLRGQGDTTPIIVLTAEDDDFEESHMLKLGADNYIVKGKGMRQVIAHLEALLRRTRAVPMGARELVVGALTLDPDSREVRNGGNEVALTATEFDLLAHLMSNPRKVFTRDELLSQVWGYAAMVGTRTVDVHVAQLRSKLGQEVIETKVGVGYRMGALAA